MKLVHGNAKKLSSESSSPGLRVLAKHIIESDDRLHFVEDDKDVFLKTPDPSTHNCPKCQSVDNWKYADHDFQDDGLKFVRFVCHTEVGEDFDFVKCGGETVFLLGDSLLLEDV